MPLTALINYLTGAEAAEQARKEQVSQLRRECAKNVKKHEELRKTLEEDPIAELLRAANGRPRK